jgi:hypothetical protein
LPTREKKERVPISAGLSAQVLVAHNHTCCVCHDVSKEVQIHHIDDDPSNNDVANLAVLCFDDHNRTQIRGGFGKHLLATEVTIYRDEWLKDVQTRRERANELASIRMAGATPHKSNQPEDDEEEARMIAADPALTAYALGIPSVIKAAHERVRPRFDSGITTEMVLGIAELLDVAESIWIHLARWFPPGHFGGHDPAAFINEYRGHRIAWHRALQEPDGPGTGGTMLRYTVPGAALSDLEDAIAETVMALLEGHEGFSWRQWSKDFAAARNAS